MQTQTRKLIGMVLATVLCGTILSQNAQACTDFELTANDGTVLITRSMEFAPDLKSNILTSSRDRSYNTTLPDGKAGMSWRSKYGYLFADGLNMGVAIDGMNEKGLSFEYLYLPGETEYQSVPAGKNKNALPYDYFGDWVLGNFQSIDEVRKALNDVYVTNAKISQVPNVIFPLHAAIYDANGKSIIVEFVKGKMNIYDNNVGILTNCPTYDWQITNLRNYLSLSPYTPNPITVNGITYAATGQGSGMIGLPGDTSPPSRFVKVAVLKKTALPTKDANEVLNLAEHIINTVDIPLGSVRAKQASGPDSNELTQWVVFKDLTHKLFYYRTYNNMTLHSIDMTKIDFSPDAKQLKMPMDNGPNVQDMTQQFEQQKASA